MDLRIATFNCENLFSRPKIFAETAAKSKTLLGYVAELKAELSNDIFNHARIKTLKQRLSGYATVVDVRGKHTTADGAGEWLGWVELTRSEVNDDAVINTARVISHVDADVICLVEVEDRILLQRFHDGMLVKEFLKPQNRDGYPHVLLIDGNDDRGIDISFFSRLPVRSLRTHIDEQTTYDGKPIKTFSRDCLEVDLDLPGGRVLHMLLNHLKSMGYSPSNDPQSNLRRLGQARRVAEIVGAKDLQSDFVVVAGDLNSEPTSESLAPLIGMSGLHNLVGDLPVEERATYRTGKQLDYLLVSTALKARLQSVRVERRGIYTKTKWPHFDEVTNTRTQASDHGAVIAEFQI